MSILFLGPDNKPQLSIVDFLKSSGESVIKVNQVLDINFIKKHNFKYLISYGYRHIIKNRILKVFSENAINLHISYLPWNKGSDPNLWSFLEDTPKGVTAHVMSEKIDQGKILFQKNIYFNNQDTLKTSYNKLNDAMVGLFINNWSKIKNNNIKLNPQIIEGTYHRSSDKELYNSLLKDGWDTKVYTLINKAKNV